MTATESEMVIKLSFIHSFFLSFIYLFIYLLVFSFIHLLMRELCRLNVDIACLTEARLEGSGKQVVEEHTLIHSGGKDRHWGVCLVPKKSKKLLPR